MRPEEAHMAYEGLRDRLHDGLLSEEVYHPLVHALRWQDRQGVWWQINPRTGSELRWSGSAWEGSAVAAESVARPAHDHEEPVPAESDGRVRKFLTRLALLVGLALVGYRLLPSVFSNSITVVVLLVATWLLMWGSRHVLAMGIRKLDSLPLFEGIWSWHRRTAPGLRKLGGIAVPMGLSFAMTPSLTELFGDSGFLVFLTVVAVNTVVAHFFFGPAPELPEGRSQ